MRVASARPSSFEINSLQFLRTHSFQALELASDVEARGLSVDGVVEERMDISGRYIEGRTEGVAMLEEDIEGFGGGDGAGEARFAEGGSGGGEEGGEGGGGEVVVEEGFVADDDQFDEIPSVVAAAAAAAAAGPGDDFR